ncbi:Ent-copalyl diphosphate synthase protein [Thalictrum thalictroides]|uniref:Ent-copalyl diphosphate synthase protein n=1 Tax=Thalictrum thalictroides TaxID=46969 RepID=A0A7J6VPE7_THATH|nr:Ent-copalyl diphosphate synthase protein [Thalictrum thalictroides]
MQHPNGSFLCSPSSTAYALMQTKDENCFRYLAGIVQKFNGGVPHSYPMDLFEQLWVVDRLERLGFSRFFKSEIKKILDYVYGCWTRNGISWSKDTIEFDIDDTCMGFRMMRLHGYDVNASAIQHFERDGQFFCFVGQNSQGLTEMLSLYRASQVLFPQESILEEAKSFSSNFLRKKQELGEVADRWLITKDLAGEVKYYMDVPWYANLPRIETRHYIEQYGGDDDVWIAKTLYRMYNVSTNDYLDLAKLDYNHCQKLHQSEWLGIQKWCEDYNLRDFNLYNDDLLKYYFVAMSSIFEPEKATERIAWAKTAALVELVSKYFKETSVDQKKDFIQAFNYGAKNELVEVILKTLSDISLEVRAVHGKEVYPDLKHAWNTWLMNLTIEGDNELVPNNEAELLVSTINLCAGHSSSDGLNSLPEYVRLTKLTNEICNHLHQTENFKVGKQNNCSEEKFDSIDLKMQELVQHAIKSNDEVDQETKRTFLTVAKSYYYTAYCEPTTIDNHIAKVLFEEVV